MVESFLKKLKSITNRNQIDLMFEQVEKNVTEPEWDENIPIDTFECDNQQKKKTSF